MPLPQQLLEHAEPGFLFQIALLGPSIAQARARPATPDGVHVVPEVLPRNLAVNRASVVRDAFVSITVEP